MSREGGLVGYFEKQKAAKPGKKLFPSLDNITKNMRKPGTARGKKRR